MKGRKGKAAGTILLVCILMAITAMPAMAASRKKISSINLEVESDVQPETRFGDETVDVTVRGGKCYYDSYEINNEGFEWEDTMVPEIVIYLRADDGYYFSLTKASSVRLSGATYVKATKQDSSETLKLTVKLAPLSESVGEQSEVTLSDNGYALWKTVQGAGSYELRLYRNDEPIGVSLLTTEELNYNLQSQMRRAGTYYVKVRPVNKVNKEKKGDWKQSKPVTISEEQASKIRNGEAGGIPVTGEWKSDSIGWWYEHSDGTITRANWEEIGGQWYFFDEKGYMKTGWISWNGKRYYCQTSGVMLKNGIAPDGTILDENGLPKTD